MTISGAMFSKQQVLYNSDLGGSFSRDKVYNEKIFPDLKTSGGGRHKAVDRRRSPQPRGLPGAAVLSQRLPVDGRRQPDVVLQAAVDGC